jgi:hypothetical protein
MATASTLILFIYLLLWFHICNWRTVTYCPLLLYWTVAPCCGIYVRNKQAGRLVGSSFAVKGFWALWDNIYDVCVITAAMAMLLGDLGIIGYYLWLRVSTTLNG